MQDLPAKTSGGGTLMVFALSGPLKTASETRKRPETTGQAFPPQPSDRWEER
jgi:hypothetical protein